jgi:hypothetical protein
VADDVMAEQDPLLTALHRVYIEGLPDDQQALLVGRMRPEVAAIHLGEALERIADSDLDRLQKWHVAATLELRRPDRIDDPAIVASFAKLVALGDADLVPEIVEQRNAATSTDRPSARG